jgi:hypothetical protein
MPLARYFLLVGGALLALLFLVDASMPILPLADGANSSRATIRINSDLKLPERVVYDTSLPTVVPGPAANAERDAIGQAVTIVAVPAKTQDAFAELQTSDAIRVRPPEARKREVRQRKSARKRIAPYEFRMARQPQFGWFGPFIW